MTIERTTPHACEAMQDRPCLCVFHTAPRYYSRQGGTTVDFCADADDLSEDRRSLDMSSVQWPGYTAGGLLTSGNIARPSAAQQCVRWYRLREPQRYLWLGGWFVLAARDCCFGRFEATSRVGPVTEWLRGGAAAAAQSKRTLWNCVGGAIPIDRRHIIALDQIGPVLHHFDRCHLDDLPQCQCHSDNLPHTACL
jgi:hypothetical protein